MSDEKREFMPLFNGEGSLVNSSTEPDVGPSIAAIEARHAEEIENLQSERDRAIELMNTIDRGHPDVEEFNRELREKAGKL